MSNLRVSHCLVSSSQMTVEYQRQFDEEPDEDRDVKQHEGVQRCLGLGGDRSWSQVLGTLIDFNREE